MQRLPTYTSTPRHGLSPPLCLLQCDLANDMVSVICKIQKLCTGIYKKASRHVDLCTESGPAITGMTLQPGACYRVYIPRLNKHPRDFHSCGLHVDDTNSFVINIRNVEDSSAIDCHPCCAQIGVCRRATITGETNSPGTGDS